MAEPTLVQVFGAGATQTADTLTIQKTALVAKGLTAAVDNTAESLLVAIMLVARDRLTTENQNSNPEQSITIDDGFESLTTRNNIKYRQTPLSLNLQRPDTGTLIDPDDY